MKILAIIFSLLFSSGRAGPSDSVCCYDDDFEHKICSAITCKPGEHPECSCVDDPARPACVCEPNSGDERWRLVCLKKKKEARRCSCEKLDKQNHVWVFEDEEGVKLFFDLPRDQRDDYE